MCTWTNSTVYIVQVAIAGRACPHMHELHATVGDHPVSGVHAQVKGVSEVSELTPCNIIKSRTACSYLVTSKLMYGFNLIIFTTILYVKKETNKLQGCERVSVYNCVHN